MKIKFALAGVALGVAMAAGNAHAFTRPLGTLGSVDDDMWHVMVGSKTFTDYLTFSVAGPSLLSGTFTDNYLGLLGLGLVNIGSLNVSLYEQAGSTWNFVGTLATGGAGDFTADSFSDYSIGSGSYRFKIDGQLAALLPPLLGLGSYGYAISAAPVPEPGEWALMLGGLGLVGSLARRRAKQKI